MNRIFCFFLFLFYFTYFSAHAQKLQYGAKGSLAVTIPYPISGVIEKNLYRAIPGITGGLGLTANYYLDKKFNMNILSGIQFQVKTFSFQLFDLDVENVKGRVSYRPVFISYELPVIFCLEKERKKKADRYINYQLGAVLSYNTLYMINGHQKGPFLRDPDGDTLLSSFDVTADNLKTFSPDIYLGISWIHKQKKRRVSEWGLSLQYAIMNSASYHFTGYVLTMRDRKDYDASFVSKLSYVSVHYIFYPKRWISL